MTTKKRLDLSEKMRLGAIIVESEEKGEKQSKIRVQLNLSSSVYHSCKSIYIQTTEEAAKNKRIAKEEAAAATNEQRRILAKAVLMLKEEHPKAYDYVAQYVNKVQEIEQKEIESKLKAEIEEEYQRKLAEVETKLTNDRVDLDSMLVH